MTWGGSVKKFLDDPEWELETTSIFGGFRSTSLDFGMLYEPYISENEEKCRDKISGNRIMNQIVL